MCPPPPAPSPRAASALLVIAGANLSTQAAKLLLARALTPEVATLPSGHATLALTSAAAVVLLAPPRWRRAALVGAGAWGTLGCLGVIAAYWHTLGDVVAAIKKAGRREPITPQLLDRVACELIGVASPSI